MRRAWGMAVVVSAGVGCATMEVGTRYDDREVRRTVERLAPQSWQLETEVRVDQMGVAYRYVRVRARRVARCPERVRREVDRVQVAYRRRVVSTNPFASATEALVGVSGLILAGGGGGLLAFDGTESVAGWSLLAGGALLAPWLLVGLGNLAQEREDRVPLGVQTLVAEEARVCGEALVGGLAVRVVAGPPGRESVVAAGNVVGEWASLFVDHEAFTRAEPPVFVEVEGRRIEVGELERDLAALRGRRD